MKLSFADVPEEYMFSPPGVLLLSINNNLSKLTIISLMTIVSSNKCINPPNSLEILVGLV